MVFSSVPLYLDPPNWQQHPNQQQVQQHHHHQQQQQQQICHNNSNQHAQNHQHQLIPLPSSQVPQPHQMGMLNGSGGGGGGGGGGVGPGAQQIRANSMSERARLAKIPPPEVPLKCPRCESNNTKFCYYNNYSLTQPRHFCKTCRRYWTRGGALRNVPVGGGCRRNKRTSSNNSNNKSSSGGGGGGAMSAKSGLSLTSQLNMVNGDHHLVSDSRGINVNSLSGSGNGMSFMASLQNIAQLGGMSNNMMSNIAQLAFSPNSNTTPLGGVGSGVGAGAGAGAGGVGYNLGFPQQQQQVQFPNFLGGFEIPGSSEGTGGLYSTLFQNIQNRHHNGNNNQGIEDENEVEENQPQELLLNVNNMSKSCSSTSMITPVKMEDNNIGQQGLNLAKQLMMGISPSTNNNHNHNNNNNLLPRNINNSNSNSNSNNNQFWGGNMTNGAAVTSMWTDLSGLNSSSTTHLL